MDGNLAMAHDQVDCGEHDGELSARAKAYRRYIAGLKLTEKSAYGRCEFVCKVMVEKFPELNLIRGYYWDVEWGKREHWWITDLEESIIDPTAIQFPSKGIGHYEPWLAYSREPTGKCPHCGEYCYNHETVHDECKESFMEYMNS